MPLLKLFFILFLLFNIGLIGYVVFLPLFVLLKMPIKKITNWVNANIIRILLTVANIVCFWVICSIRLNVIPKINTSWNQNFCDNLNEVFVNLSYSFFAGFIFFLLTVVIPDYKRKKKIKPILHLRVEACFRIIDSIINKFANCSSSVCQRSLSRDELSVILDSKKWRDVIPELKISYIEYISLQGKYLRRNVLEMIDLYNDQMSENQIADLEHLIGMLIFKNADSLSAMPQIGLDHPQGKKSLINDFCNMYSKFQEIYKTFEINEKIYTK